MNFEELIIKNRKIRFCHIAIYIHLINLYLMNISHILYIFVDNNYHLSSMVIKLFVYQQNY